MAAVEPAGSQLELRIEDNQHHGVSQKEQDETSKTFIKIVAAVAGVGALVLVIVLPIYFEVIVPNQQRNQDVAAAVPDNDRFNCIPDGVDVSQETCTSRGCVWAEPVSNPQAPWCFYAEGDGYQSTGSIQEDTEGYTVNLARSNAAPSPYGADFEKLTVRITRVTREKLRVRIFPETKRFEVPWTHETPSGVYDSDALYSVQFRSGPGGTFAFQVVRKDTMKVLFDTSVGKLTFVDKFIEISTKLPSDYVYGFGEHMHETWKHDMNWKSYGMFSRDQGVGPNSNLYGVHPFYMNMEGDGNAHGVLFLNSNAQDVTLQPTPALTYRTIGGLLDIYMFVGPTPEQVVQQYTATIGRPYMPPYWALGFQLSRYGYGSLDKLKKVVDRNLAAGYPYDTQYSDIDYMDRQLDFTINQTTYNGLEDFVRDLKTTHNMRYIIILDPAISGNETAGTYPPFDLGQENNVFIRTPSNEIAFGKVWPDLPGIYINTSLDWDYQTENYRAYAAFPDFALPRTKQWWTNLTIDFYKRIEFDGLWIDMNEPASFVHGSPTGCPDEEYDNPPYHPHILGPTIYDKTTCMSNLQFNPATRTDEKHYNMHSLYGWSQSLPTLDACRASTGERCMVISRSTFPGSGKYVGHWLGDNTSMWEHLRASIIGMLEFNLFGIPYIGADICGFFQDTTDELCMRWMQLGAFYPFGRNHNGLNFRDQDPAFFGPKFVEATRKILEVRYMLLPHFYTLFYDANTAGSTVLRSLMAEFADDLETYTIQEQFLLGSGILVSPAVYEGVDSVTGYAPDARWFDFYTGVEVGRGARKTWTSFYAPYDHMPIHLRGGTIVPTQQPARTTDLQRNNPLGLLYAMDDNNEGSGHLFWDDGNSIDTIANGQYLLIHFVGTKDSITMTVDHDGYDGGQVFDNINVMGVTSDHVVKVLVNGVQHDTYVFDATAKRLHITGLTLSLKESWTVVWDANEYVTRFDCHPDVGATVTKCLDRQCLWDPVGVPNVPPCYFPENYGMYKKDTAPTYVNNTLPVSEYLFLEKLSGKPTFFNDPVQRLRVDVETRSEHQLRIKIWDPANPRYEVPLEVGGVKSTPVTEPLFEVIYQDEPFGFKVVRRSTREVIMDTSVGALIYEDQFLQLSTKASTSYLYGLGEFEHANYANDFYWNNQALHARDEGVKQDANLYGYHPYHLTMEKNGDAHGVLMLTSTPMEVVLTPLPSITYRTIGGILDFYLFLGPTPELVTQQYSQAIGLPMMPPYWSLGFQLCKYGYGSIEEMQKVVEGMKDYDIPQDVQYGDIDYMERQLDFTVDPVRYFNLSGYVDQMRDQYKMRYVIILDPAISANETTGSYPPYDEGMDLDIFIRDAKGDVLYGLVWPDLPGTLYNESTYDTRAHVAFPDYFKPEATQWWKDNVVRFRSELKFDGLWIDMNEPASFRLRGDICPRTNKYDNPPYLPQITGPTLYDKSICMSAKQYDPDTGTSSQLHYNVHSLYGWSEAESTMVACRNATGKRCYVISRSTYPGGGKYVGHWLGDNTSKWPHLRASIIGMFEFSLFGFAYTGADICGFFEDAEEEMCLRWSQLGAFYPFSRNHAMLDTRRQDPAAWGPEFAANVKKVLETRYTLLPYLYTLFYHANTKGSTVVRPLLHEFTQDKMTWDIDRQMLWGPALLISPVLEAGKLAVEAYFTDARWFDYYTGLEVPVRGGTYVLSAPKDHINLHVRGGYILPTQAPARTTYYSRQNPFGLIVALDDDYKATSGDLFWDDGEDIDTVGSKAYTHVTFSSEGGELTSNVVNDGFADSASMTLDTVTVFGLRDVVTQVQVGGVAVLSYTQDATTKALTVTPLSLQLNQPFNIRWELNNEWSRFDCMPDLNNDVNRAACESRGCTWQSTTTPGVPSCFYGSNAVHGYNVDSTITPNQYLLRRRNTMYSMYEGDIDVVQLDVQYQTANRLRLKFSDPNNPSRYEVPNEALTIDNTENSDAASAQYNVSVENIPFSVRVNHGTETIFDSSVGAFSFADQFLQISTSLASTNVYGFGEHNHRRYRHDLNWRRWAIFTRDVAPVDDWNLYGHQTFFMAMESSNDGKSYGVYLHNSNAMDVTLQPTPALTYRVTGGILDFYLFVGDSPEEVVREYHNIIGYPVMPPYWGLGFQLSRWDYGSLDRVKEVVSEMRAAKIPFDIQYGDIDYMDAKKAFTYDPVLYDGLPQFVDDLHSWGMRYVVILDPGIKIETGYKAYDDGVAADIFIKDPSGANLVTEVWPGETHHPDYTHPNAADWWYQQCEDFYTNLGVHYDALWIDMNEPANFQPDDPVKLAAMNCTGKYNFPPYMPRILWYGVGLHDKTFCMDNVQEWGLHYDVHSLYGHTMAQATYTTLERQFPDKRSFLFSRSTFAGSGKYSGHWSGDNQSQWRQMAWTIPIMFEFNLFGFSYIGADVCGFWYNTTAEMCQRWTQVGAFYPFSRNHNAAGMIPQHPTAFGDEFATNAREILLIRYSILPYMYTLFRDVHVGGGTLVRALVHEFPSDMNTWDVHRQFLIGPAFLVTPVLDEGVTQVTGYFPGASRWYDFRTGTEVEGGKFTLLDAPMDYINLHVRGGYILPMQAPDVTTAASRQNPMSLLVALDGAEQASGRLYWDDGEQRDMTTNYTILELECSANTVSTTILESVGDLPGLGVLYFDAVTVYGITANAVTNVTVDSSLWITYHFNAATGSLKISSLNLAVDTGHTISWTN